MSEKRAVSLFGFRFSAVVSKNVAKTCFVFVFVFVF